MRSSEIKKVVAQKSLYLIDLDGVLVRGGQPLPSAVGFIKRLLKRKQAFVILTNNSTKTASQYAIRLRRLGFPVTPDHFVTSIDGTLWYLRTRRKLKSAYVIGENGLRQSIKKQLILYPSLKKKKSSPDCVIVGLDTQCTYRKLALAQHYLLNGAEFIATNKDLTFPAKEGIRPGGGILVVALEACSFKKATVIGKPSLWLSKMLKERFPFCLDSWLMIGDRYDTDIAFASRVGIDSLLVETGIDKAERKPSYPATFYLPNLTPLYKALA